MIGRHGVLRLTPKQCSLLENDLPGATLVFLRDTGVPERIDFCCGVPLTFTLDMEPLLHSWAFRVGTNYYEDILAIERTTGHFGSVKSRDPPLVFYNSSIAQFLECVAASEKLWKLEAAKQIDWYKRGEYLEGEFRRIDPAVFDDDENIWSCLVWELREGVV